MEDIIDQASRAEEIICYYKQMKPISKKEHTTVKTKLKMNKTNDLSGWKNELTKHAGKHLDSSISKILNEAVKHVTTHKEWEYMKIRSIYRGKGNKEEMNNQRGIFITNILSEFFERIIHTKIKNNLTKNKVAVAH